MTDFSGWTDRQLHAALQLCRERAQSRVTQAKRNQLLRMAADIEDELFHRGRL